MYTLASVGVERVRELEIILKNGKILKNVEFLNFTPVYVTAKWTGGIGSLKYDVLPDQVLRKIRDKIPAPLTEEQIKQESEKSEAREIAAKEKSKIEAEKQRIRNLINAHLIETGMTREQVTMAWGKPEK